MQKQETDCLLSVSDISKSFPQPDGTFVRVLNGMSFDIAVHTIMAVMGPNGCGKTTLLNLVAGSLEPDSGSIGLNDTDISQFPAGRRSRFIGRVHQESYKALAADLTVAEMLSIADKRQERLSLSFPNAGLALGVLGDYCSSVADFMRDKANVPAHILSGGQRQLLALALAVLGRPKVLLLDEHLSSLDQSFEDVANDLLATYIEVEDSCALAVTHDSNWVRLHCVRMARFENHGFKVSDVSCQLNETT